MRVRSNDFILVAAVTLLGCSSLDNHFAPTLVIEEAVYPETYSGPKPIAARQALHFALRSLEQRGVSDIRFCRINWIVAGVGGAIVQAKGRWEKDGVTFNAFAVGICDGTEAKYGNAGGDEFFVLARGVNQKGEETYYYSGEKGASPGVLRYSEIAGDSEVELIFEYASREMLIDLPAQCGAGRVPRRDVD